LVTDCLEMDIVINTDNGLNVYHPPQKTSLKFNDLLNKIIKKKNLSYWFDTKNLNSKESCEIMLEELTALHGKFKKILLEIQPYSHKYLDGFSSCVEKIKDIKNVYLSYYVPTSLAIACSNNLNLGVKFNSSESCLLLKKDIEEIKKSNYFKNISFNFSGFKAIKELNVASDFLFNAWGVKPDDYDQIKSTNNFNMIIPINTDPNNI